MKFSPVVAEEILTQNILLS